MTTQPFLHRLADVQSPHIGTGSKIWQFCVVLPGATIGADCNICSHCFIENDVVVGDRCTIKNGVHLWGGLCLEDDVFVGPNVTFTNDRFPKSRRADEQEPFTPTPTIIEAGASIGGGATLLPGIRVGRRALIGAGALVAEDVPAGAVVIGPKARVRE